MSSDFVSPFSQSGNGFFSDTGICNPFNQHAPADHSEFGNGMSLSHLATTKLRDAIISEYKLELTKRYPSGIPLTLKEALQKYCLFRERVAGKDEISRVNLIAKEFNSPFLHELTREHFSYYENKYIGILNARTIEERIALFKRIFDVLIQKQAYFGRNPLANWEPSVSSAHRKAKAQGSIASIDRVVDVFSSPEFIEFGKQHRNFYLIMITAIVTGMRITSICRLTKADFIKTIAGTPIIDLNTIDKTVAGKRQIPISEALHEALKCYLSEHKNFGIEDQGDKGCSSAISKLYANFLEINPLFELKQLNPHGLRASLNNYLSKIRIPHDIRCAFVGHKNNHVNSVSYSTPLSADTVFEELKGIQGRLLDALNFQARA